MKDSMAVNIFLKQFKEGQNFITEKLRECDATAIGLERLIGLKKILPKRETVKRFFKKKKLLRLIYIYGFNFEY